MNKIIIITLFIVMMSSCNSPTDAQKSKSNSANIENVIWNIPFSRFKRMFYGKVKSSEEIMYSLYTNNKVDGPLGRFLYYKKEGFPPVNFQVKFDSAGKIKRYTTYNMGANKDRNTRVGYEYYYDNKGKLIKRESLSKDFQGFFSTVSAEYKYDKNGNLLNSIIVNHDADYMNRFTVDSTVYKYNDKNLEIDYQHFHADQYEDDDQLKMEKDFGDYPLAYEYDRNGNVTKVIERNGEITNVYKNNFLNKIIEKSNGKSDEFVLDENGIYRNAKLRTTLVTGDFEFNETGDLVTKNGRKFADYSEYDEYGNWTKRIIYKENGEPHTYTERIIEYYE